MNALRAETAIFAPTETYQPDFSKSGGAERFDPFFLKAVDAILTLDERGVRLDLETRDNHAASGDGKAGYTPYEALAAISQMLRDFGMSAHLADEFVEAIEAQIIHLGVDFTQKEKPTPLLIRVCVMDKKPELDADKTHFMVAWDRRGKHGSDFSSVEAHLTNTGTKLTTTKVPKFEELFAKGNEKYLVVHFEKLEGEGVKGLDQAGANLATLVQAVGIDGAAAMKEVRTAIEQGTLPPQAQELVATIAELKKVLEDSKTPGAIENPAATIDKLKTAIIEISAALTAQPALVEALPKEAQAAIVNIQTEILSTISHDNTVVQQIVKLETAHKDELKFLLEKADLPEIEREKYIAEIKAGQTTIETLQQMVSRIAEVSPALNISYAQEHVKELTAQAAAAVGKPIPLSIDPVIREQVIAAVVQLPVSAATAQQVTQGATSKAAIANVIVAAASQPSRAVNHYIQEATRQIIKAEAAPVANYLRSNPLPQIPAAVVAKLEAGQRISAPEIQKIASNPATPRPVAKALEQVGAAQKQTTAYVSPAQIKTELAQIQKILQKTDPVLARHVEQFRERFPDATAKDVIKWVESMPPATRASFDSAADKSAKYETPHFRPNNTPEFIQLIDKHIDGLPDHARKPFTDIVEKVRLGEPINREELSDLVKNLPPEAHAKISELVTEIKTKEDGLKNLCDGNCSACPNRESCKGAHLAALKELETDPDVPNRKPHGYSLNPAPAH